MRSKWKSKPEFIVGDEAFFEERVVVVNPGTYIPRLLLNKRVDLHTGNRFFSMIIRDYMINRRFSEFISTKRSGSIIHKKN